MSWRAIAVSVSRSEAFWKSHRKCQQQEQLAVIFVVI
jgi:hypothetical protein